MLQQILADMYIDPELLEALNEEQKKTLFLKMREEQVRRWKEREEKEGKEGRKEKAKPKKGPCKNVSWLLGRDGDVHVFVIGEPEEFKSPKLMLSDLTAQKETNLSKDIRSLKSNLANRKPQEGNSKMGIELLLKKAEEMNYSCTLGQNQQQQGTKDDSDSSDSSNSEPERNSDTAVARTCRATEDTAVVQRLNQLNLQRSGSEQLPVKEKPSPGDMPICEKGGVNTQSSGSSYGSRVAQLRRNFNPTGAKPTSPCSKPPIPSKPAHLLASASVR